MSLTSYNINWDKWISDNLHPERRKPKRIALLRALIKRIRDIHSEFITVHDENKEKLSWNGQRILLQRYLQLKFGDGIIIENVDSATTVQIEYEADNLSNPITFITPDFRNPIAGEAGEGNLGAGFIVKVPGGISFDENQMRATIEQYLINYKNYVIQII